MVFINLLFSPPHNPNKSTEIWICIEQGITHILSEKATTSPMYGRFFGAIYYYFGYNVDNSFHESLLETYNSMHEHAAYVQQFV